MGTLRRWAAGTSGLLLFVAAVAAASPSIDATEPPPEPAAGSFYVPVDTACRLVDTRSDAPPQTFPLDRFGPDTTQTFQPTLVQGDCEAPNATALVLNVTALNATDPTFVTLWPGGPRPNASNLNPTPDQPPTPNQVVVPVSPDGELSVYNAFGTVDIIIDLVGYYTADRLDDIAAARAFAESNVRPQNLALDTDARWVINETIMAPTPGHAVVTANIAIDADGNGTDVRCNIFANAEAPNLSPNLAGYIRWETGGDANLGSRSATRTIAVDSGQNVFALFCEREGGAATITVASMTAMFIGDKPDLSSVAPTSFVPVTPCRLMDTRSGPSHVGPQITFVEGQTQRVGLDTKATDCPEAVIAGDSTAVALNVTALNASAPTFLTIWPAFDLERPPVSSLNPSPGQPPVPNAVTTQISQDGFDVYNAFGSVDVVIDLVGYYDIQQPARVADALLAEVSDAIDGANKALGSTPETMLELNVGFSGDATVISGAAVQQGVDGGQVRCEMYNHTAPTSIDTDAQGTTWFRRGGSSNLATLSGTRVFDIAQSGLRKVGLACAEFSGSSGEVTMANLSALVTPSSSRPADLTGTNVYLPVTPCRLVDTRPGDDRIGPHDAISGDETIYVVPRVDPGECDSDVLPPGTAAAVLNVTAIGATEPTFLTLWGDGDRPDSSNLNPVPEQPPTPNSVTTPVTTDGAISLYNAFGSVDVIVDLVGIHTSVPLETLQQAVPLVRSSVRTSNLELTGTNQSVVAVGVDAPTSGTVTAIGNVTVRQINQGGDVWCYLSEDAPVADVNTAGYMRWETDTLSTHGTLSGTRTFDVEAGSELFYVSCTEGGGDAQIIAANVTAIFLPD